MQHKPPESYIVMLAEIALPRSKQLIDPWQHNPMNAKQSKHHCPQLICYRTLKKKVIYCFPKPFAHTTIVYHNNSLFPKIIYIIKILPKAANHEKNATLGGTFACQTVFQENGMTLEGDS